MKVFINENKLKSVIFKYFDTLKKQGKEIKITRTTGKLFKVDMDTMLGYLVDYLGFDEAVNLAKEKLKQLPDRIRIIDSQFEGELYFSLYEIGSIAEYGYLPVLVDCYGDVSNVQVWNDDNDEYDIVENMSLYDWYSQEDMTGGWEIKDMLVSDINSQLGSMITPYTGIEINVEGMSIIDG